MHKDGGVLWDALRADFGDHDVPVVIDNQERKTMRLEEAIHLSIRRQRQMCIRDRHGPTRGIPTFSCRTAHLPSLQMIVRFLSNRKG